MECIKFEPVVSTVVLSFRFTKDRFFGCHIQEHTCQRDILSHLPTGLVRLETMRPIARGGFRSRCLWDATCAEHVRGQDESLSAQRIRDGFPTLYPTTRLTRFRRTNS